mmetsp:Transcript_12540/g.39249  ORF Transcript_12540/g.39249 Transcript_12540/m.39249 type:complete len:354 (+) Transcript_12540:371-1432(+)
MRWMKSPGASGGAAAAVLAAAGWGRAASGSGAGVGAAPTRPTASTASGAWKKWPILKTPKNSVVDTTPSPSASSPSKAYADSALVSGGSKARAPLSNSRWSTVPLPSTSSLPKAPSSVSLGGPMRCAKLATVIGGAAGPPLVGASPFTAARTAGAPVLARDSFALMAWTASGVWKKCPMARTAANSLECTFSSWSASRPSKAYMACRLERGGLKSFRQPTNSWRSMKPSSFLSISRKASCGVTAPMRSFSSAAVMGAAVAFCAAGPSGRGRAAAPPPASASIVWKNLPSLSTAMNSVDPTLPSWSASKPLKAYPACDWLRGEAKACAPALNSSASSEPSPSPSSLRKASCGHS